MKPFLLFAAAVVFTASLSAELLRPEAINGALVGGVIGAVVGNNSGGHNGGRGAAIGAGAGFLVGSAVGASHDRRGDGGYYSSGYGYGSPYRMHSRFGTYRDYGYPRHDYYDYDGYGYYGSPYRSYGGWGYSAGYDDYDSGYAYSDGGRSNYAVDGLFWGGLAGAIIGHNSGDLGHNGWRGAALGAGAGLLIGSVAEHNARIRDARIQDQRAAQDASVTPTPAPALSVEPSAPPTPVRAATVAPLSPMASANSLFGR